MCQRKPMTEAQNQFKKINLIDDEVEDHPLCLCEYFNKENQRSHILMCCCNCEALDTFCTSCLCCCCEENDQDVAKSIINKNIKDVFDDIQDRLRIPFPGGARQIDLDYFMTIVALFIFIKIGTHGFIFSILSIFILPLIIYPIFFMKRRTNRTSTVKTGFFLILNALIINMYVLNFKLEYMDGFKTKEFYTLNFLILSALIFLFTMKNSDPGFIKTQSNINSLGKNYCKQCNILKDLKSDNSGHCPQCSRCIYQRDHHCFWIDNCVGFLNHRKFFTFIFYLLILFLYSFKVCINVLFRVECKFPLDCLSETFYSNFSKSYISLMTIQLVPLSCYMILLISQQLLFICVGKTQYQLFRQSQINVRFSLILYLADNLSLNESIKNLKYFFTRTRSQTEIDKKCTKTFLTV